MFRALVLLAFVCLLAARAPALALPYKSEHYALRLVTVAEGLSYPWGLAFLPDGNMLVTERKGRLRIVAPSGRLSPPLDGVPEVYAVGQGGLLDVALDPHDPRDAWVLQVALALGRMTGRDRRPAH